jgi:hypothetical protein
MQAAAFTIGRPPQRVVHLLLSKETQAVAIHQATSVPGNSIAISTSRPRVYKIDGNGFATDTTRTSTVFHRNFTTKSWMTTTAIIARTAKAGEPLESENLSEPLTNAE